MWGDDTFFVQDKEHEEVFELALEPRYLINSVKRSLNRRTVSRNQHAFNSGIFVLPRGSIAESLFL
jgi:hypothetical protein